MRFQINGADISDEYGSKSSWVSFPGFSTVDEVYRNLELLSCLPKDSFQNAEE